ncbi:hypothetical protein ACWCTA_01535 [Streptomyces sp. NPDC001704]
MWVRIEKVPERSIATAGASRSPLKVRVHSDVGTTVAVWCGAPEEADGGHHIEWSVDENLLWGHNTQLAAVAEPGVRQEREQVVLRGRLALTSDGLATLDVGGAHILFDHLTCPPGVAPPPQGGDGTWVEIRVAADSVGAWPFQL